MLESSLGEDFNGLRKASAVHDARDLPAGELVRLFVAKAVVKRKLVVLAFVLCFAVGGADVASYGALGNKSRPTKLEKSNTPPANRSEVATGQQKALVATDLYGDPLPPGAVARLGTARFRHGTSTHALTFSPDGKVLASAGIATIDVSLWDASTGRLLHRVGDSNIYDSFAFAPDGKKVFTGTALSLIDVATGKESHPFAEPSEGAMLYRVAFSPDGRMVAAGGHVAPEGTKIILWDVATGKELLRLDGVSDGVAALAFAPDAKTLVAANYKNSLRILDIGTGKELHRFVGQDSHTRCATFSPSGEVLACGGDGGVIHLWNIKANKLLFTLNGDGPKGTILTLAFAADGKRMASAGRGGTVCLWNTQTGQEIGRRFVHHRSILAMAFSPNLEVLATTASDDSAIRRWNTVTGKEIGPVTGHTGKVQRLVFAPDGATLFSSCTDRKVLDWELASGRSGGRFFGGPLGLATGEGHIWEGDLAEDGKTVAWIDHSLEKSASPSIRVTDAATGKELNTAIGLARETSHLRLSPDAKVLAVSSEDALRLWNVAEGKVLHQFPGFQGSAVFSPDGKTVAAFANNSIGHWDVATGIKLHQWSTSPDVSNRFLVFSPRGELLVLVEMGDESRVWSPESGKDLVTIKGLGFVDSLAISPSSRILAVVGLTFTTDENGESRATYDINLWDLWTGQEIRRLPADQCKISSLAFSPNGRILASGGTDSTILLWDLTGKLANDKLKQVQLTASELEALWADLSSSATKADRAIWVLATRPQQSLPLLKKRMLVTPASAEEVARLFVDLDSPQYGVRQKAGKTLNQLGEAAEGAVRKALKGKPTLEVRQRLEQFLNKCDEEAIRKLRALEALEHIGTVEARQVLAMLAKSSPNPAVALGAAAALERGAKRQPR